MYHNPKSFSMLVIFLESCLFCIMWSQSSRVMKSNAFHSNKDSCILEVVAGKVVGSPWTFFPSAPELISCLQNASRGHLVQTYTLHSRLFFILLPWKKHIWIFDCKGTIKTEKYTQLFKKVYLGCTSLHWRGKTMAYCAGRNQRELDQINIWCPAQTPRGWNNYPSDVLIFGTLGSMRELWSHFCQSCKFFLCPLVPGSSCHFGVFSWVALLIIATTAPRLYLLFVFFFLLNHPFKSEA